MDTLLAKQLREVFRYACATLELTGNIDEEFDSIRDAYMSSARGYHDLGHIAEAVDFFESNHVRMSTLEQAQVHLALILHDIIDPSSVNAEIKSSDYASEMFLRLGANEINDDLTIILDAILATAFHLSPKFREEYVSKSKVISWTLDSDLCRFLDLDWPKWERGIRHEYPDTPQEDYLAGRAIVLQKFLTVTPLYFHLDEDDCNIARILIQEQIDHLT